MEKQVRNQWLAIGLLVFVVGMAIGLIVPRSYQPHNEDVPVSVQLNNGKAQTISLDQLENEDENQLFDDNDNREFWNGWI